MSFFGGFPFGGGGGFHMGGGDDDDEPQGEVDNTHYYQTLEISKEATQNEVKRAYLNLAKVYHPDKKTGNAEKFKEITKAYQTLNDPEKRSIYDKFGTKGPSEDPNDMLRQMFGGGGGRPGRKQMPKVKATKKALEATLENIYNGELLKIKHKRARCCEECAGKGGKNVSKCKKCKGQGQVIQMIQMGPGMYQQVQRRCDECKGEGDIIGEGGKCKSCNGEKIVEKTKTLEVPVDKGIPNNSPIVLSGEGNQIPDALAGDLIFIVQEQPHETFTRKGADLLMKRSIKLVEALTGFDFSFKHLDGEEYTVATGKGQVIGDHDRKVVRGLGMPYYKDQMSHGNLIIEFTVQMPKRGEISKDQLEKLAALLPGKANARPKDDQYEMLEDFDIQGVNTNEEGGRKPDEQEEEEAEYASSNVGCASQ